MTVASSVIPLSRDSATVDAGGKSVALTNLNKVFWPELGLTKRDLLRHYERIAPALLPHIKNKPMVMKRYPNGINGDFFFMKRAPAGRPQWIRTCDIPHGSGNVISFPLIDDLASLLWVVNLGCIDLNPWYFTCDAIDRPQYLHFDLDPFGTDFAMVREAALIMRDALESLGMKPYAKTSGGNGIHIYVAIAQGPSQHDVWAFAKTLSHGLAKAHADVLTAVYKKDVRPRGRVLVDYNQNSFGRTLASIYSVRPNAFAGVSTPVEWSEIEGGCKAEDFTILNVPDRVAKIGDLWAPLAKNRGRFDLSALMKGGASA